MQTCTNPDIRNLMLAYELGQLSEEEADRFERHLFECQACATEVVEDEPLIELLKAAIQLPSQSASSSLQKTGRPEIPLPVSAVYDRTHQELTAEYYGDFGVEELAASTETSAEIHFPITVEYANGQIVAQFRKRTGDLYFRLVKSSVGTASYVCVVRYTLAEPAEKPTPLEVHEGDEKCLGSLAELIPSGTYQQTLETLRHIELALLCKEIP